ncbi:MAG TPA: SpoIIE family protein phosphatase [Candidatus Binatia bacterium]|nr:SpoIIE family protein phosphatase [Candidatus Binatia bacterium]
MQLRLPNSGDVRAFVRRVLHPRSKLGKTTLWLGYLAVALELLRAVTRSPAGTMLSGWASFVSFVFIGFSLLLGLRWLRRKLMWRLRNRLIVTYIFIGVIPIVLLVAMAFLAGYLFAGQFATYVAMSDLQSELQHLEATNRSLATQFRVLVKQGQLDQRMAGEIASASNESFRHRSVSVWDGDKGFLLGESGRAAAAGPIRASPALRGDFAGFVLDANRLQLRAVKRLEEGGHQLTVISNLPISAELLRPATSELGSVSLFPPEEKTEGGAKAASAAPAGGRQTASGESQVKVEMGGATFNVSQGREPRSVRAGSLPPAAGSLDIPFPFGTRFDLIDWSSGKSLTGLVVVETRPSMLYATLFSALGDNAGVARQVLIGIAVFFGIIELIALYIGVRLTRSMTSSVGQLYAATQHVNRGDLTHKISVRTNDQMAALEQSFNSMTQSLANLIAEQKEKQRLESELAIAHEVQALLFPADLSGLRDLEVHGVCRPARTVSGDYYDFIPLSDSRLVLAVGDISGKGISAALLMATVHAFVRAYSLEPERTLASVALGAGVAESSLLAATGRQNGDSGSELSPAYLMSTLNYQLYRSTPPEKYATMFLGCYDAVSRSLTYSNAGHLPPLLLKHSGDVTRLETSGTVVGLFDGMSYEESAVDMQAGDIFVAYSDGITEPENEFGEFGEERLVDLIVQNRDQPLARITEVVTTAVADWIAGGEQPDDVTLVLARAR